MSSLPRFIRVFPCAVNPIKPCVATRVWQRNSVSADFVLTSYQLMQSCWRKEPERRPEFSSICTIMDEMSAKHKVSHSIGMTGYSANAGCFNSKIHSDGIIIPVIRVQQKSVPSWLWSEMGVYTVRHFLPKITCISHPFICGNVGSVLQASVILAAETSQWPHSTFSLQQQTHTYVNARTVFSPDWRWFVVVQKPLTWDVPGARRAALSGPR